MKTHDPNYGRILSQRYQLAELIGEGAMGRVYRAHDNLLGGVTVAVKFLAQTLLNDNMRSRFEREATICALLGEKSIHVVRVRDYGVDEHNIPFYVMEYLPGQDISDVIRFETLSLSRFVDWIRQICLGLKAAHEGIDFKGELCRIIHRDIKPSNMLVVQDPTLGELIKILDFGIAKLVQSGSSQTRSFMGTLAYCSPEQIEGKQLDNRSDIYSLGVMMYEMLSGEMPVIPDTSSFGAWYRAHREFRPEPFDPVLKIPSALESLVMQCLSKQPQRRPQNADEIIRAIEAIQATIEPSRNSQKLNFQSRLRFDALSESKQPTQAVLTQSNLTQATQKTEVLVAPPTTETKLLLPSVEEICQQQTWPADKPQQKIVFPHIISSHEGETPTLFVMLEQQDLVKRISSMRYNQFLFIQQPHPMLLWITLLYHRQYGPRWLPCYLDLKQHRGQQLTRCLSETGYYYLLFFGLKQSQQCQQVMKATLNSKNRHLLLEWANVSQLIKNVGGNQQLSKKYLKQEYNNLKDKILLKLNSKGKGYSSDISG